MYMECSSKEMSGVHEIFETAIDVAVRGKEEDEYDEERGMASAAGGRGAGGKGGSQVAKRKKRSNCKIL